MGARRLIALYAGIAACVAALVVLAILPLGCGAERYLAGTFKISGCSR